MKHLNNLLIANDSLAGMRNALDKAAFVEHYTGAKISVAEVVYALVVEESPNGLTVPQQVQMIEALKAAERNGLRNLVEPFQTRVATADVRLLWNKNSAHALIRAAYESHADLIIKPISEHSTLGDFVHTPLDWSLMRDSPCAVLISKDKPWGNPAHILAAIDATDDSNEDLTREILVTATTLACVLGTDMHLVCVYPDFGQTVNQYQVATDYVGIKEDMKQSREHAIGEWIDKLELTVAAVHVVEGKPAPTIAKLANSIGIDIVVLGTAARTGLKKMLLGNTAEDIIGRLTCDIVTVREPGP